MIIIIADDLTGANDSGVQLSEQALKTIVYIDPLSWGNNDDSSMLLQEDVLVVDTETRELEGKQAADIIKKIVKKLELDKQKYTLFYKKIDSTLRGNIGEEVEVLMELLNKELCILAPSFPENNRITVGGYLMVNNEPLGLSQYYRGQLEPWEATYIPHFIQCQTDLPVGLIELKDVMKGEEAIRERIEALQKDGKKIIVIDSVTDAQLKDIVNSSKKVDSSMLFCGSAGLVNNFPLQHVRKNKIEPLPINDDSPVLMVVGTRNKVMESQIKYLTDRIVTSYIKIDLEEIFEDKGWALKKYTEKSLIVLEKKQHLIIHPDPCYNNEEMMKKMTGEGMTFRKKEIAIRNFLAELTENILKKNNVKNVVMTGGDTAIGICKKLGIRSLLMIEEALPGIPLSCPREKKYQDLRLITKAGGFGQENTLYCLVKKLVNKSESVIADSSKFL